MEKHTFWDKQPVTTDKKAAIGLVDSNYIKKSNEPPTEIPKILNWCCFDINDKNDFDEFHNFLLNNYNNENEDFPLHYTDDILKWSLDLNIKSYKVKNLNSLKSWNLGLRSEYGNLIGVITAVPVNLIIQGKDIDTSIVNHLCVVKELRSKGVAALLIKELVRTVRLTNPQFLKAPLFNSINLPFAPIVSVDRFVRYLNVEKLINTGYLDDIKNNECYKFSSNLQLKFASISELKECYTIFKNNLNKYDMTINFKNFDQFKKYYGNKFDNKNKPSGSIYTMVVKDEKTKKVTDWISLFYLPYAVKNDNQFIKAINLLRIETTKNDVVNLLNSAFGVATKMGFDCFNCLDLYNLKKNMKVLQLESFNNKMTYYTYNYNCGKIEQDKFAIIIP